MTKDRTRTDRSQNCPLILFKPTNSSLKKKEQHFSGSLVEFHFVLNTAKNSCSFFTWNRVENQKLQKTFIFKMRYYKVLDVVISYYYILFKYRKLAFFVKTTKIMVKFILFWLKFQDFFWLAFLKKPYTNPGKCPSKFFCKVATESGLLGAKIALWHFLNLKIHF